MACYQHFNRCTWAVAYFTYIILLIGNALALTLDGKFYRHMNVQAQGSVLTVEYTGGVFRCSAYCVRDKKCQGFNLKAISSNAVQCEMIADTTPTLLANTDYVFYKKQVYGEEISSTTSTALPTTTVPIVYPKDCRSIKDKNSSVPDGIYTVKPNLTGPAFQVVCLMSQEPVHVILSQRLSGSEDFYRTWDQYRDGFGTLGLASDFWLGLEKTRSLMESFRVSAFSLELTKHDDRKDPPEVSLDMKLGSEQQNYKILTTGKPDIFPQNCMFSTQDKDNDGEASVNCAERFHGAWWYCGCAAEDVTDLNRRLWDGNGNCPFASGSNVANKECVVLKKKTNNKYKKVKLTLFEI